MITFEMAHNYSKVKLEEKSKSIQDELDKKLEESITSAMKEGQFNSKVCVGPESEIIQGVMPYYANNYMGTAQTYTLEPHIFHALEILKKKYQELGFYFSHSSDVIYSNNMNSMKTRWFVWLDWSRRYTPPQPESKLPIKKKWYWFN